MRLKIILLFFLFFAAAIHCHAQLFFAKNTAVPVEKNSQFLKYAWAGGLNNPQFSAADINNNGIDDLVIFDRTGNKVLTFLNSGIAGQVSYSYVPHYERHFPFMNAWMLMRDFNCDGAPDIFCFSPTGAGMSVYTGSYNDENELIFTLYTNLLMYNGFSGPVNLFVTSIDIPAIEDIDGDGDLDILTFETFSSNKVEWFENTGNCDTLIFHKNDLCWGDFIEASTTNAVMLDSCKSNKNESGGSIHSGSTLTTFDVNNDGAYELLLGDLSYPTMTFLLNNGTPDSAHMFYQDNNFPFYDVPVNLPIFPAAFNLDADNDNLKDLLVAPNAKNISQNFENVWFYKNTGTPDSSIFSLQTTTFLTGDMIETGEGAYPVFFDHNGDGLLDIVIGSYGYYNNGNFTGKLFLYENTGTASNPAFTLTDEDYAGLSAYGWNAIHPTFGDLDGDGDLDMIVGESEGNLHFFRNNGTGGMAGFVLAEPFFQNIDVGQYSAPYLYDLNEDGKPDLIIGEQDDNINYYENTGTATSPVFTKVTDSLGKIDIHKGGLNAFTGLFIGVLDSTGEKSMLIASDKGVIYRYTNLENLNNFTLADTFFSAIRTGGRPAIDGADINNNGKIELIIGNYSGGVNLYYESDSLYSNVGVREKEFFIKAEIYPNPAQYTLNITLDGAEGAYSFILYNLMGQQMLQKKLSQSHEQIDVSGLNSGIYFIKINAGGSVVTKKVVIQK